MIWLASYPRSGNTFMRNVLYEVYGLESSTFHEGEEYPLDNNFDQFPVIKTHLLPAQIPKLQTGQPVVLIVRDGRDSVVSLAHHHKALRDPQADIYRIMKEAILAEKGSYFGGWSLNTEKWLERADLVVRFSDLINDPIASCERLRSVFDIPKPDRSKLPGFQELKFGKPKYGAGVQFADSEEGIAHMAASNFRKGKVGGWKEEMPEELQELFWNHHGLVMERMGFQKEGGITDPDPYFEVELREKMDLTTSFPEKPVKVLIEADKLIEPGNDGIKRYEAELLKQLKLVSSKKIKFDLLVNGLVIPMDQAMKAFEKGTLEESVKEIDSREIEVKSEVKNQHDYEMGLLAFKAKLYKTLPEAVYRYAATVYKALPFRLFLGYVRDTMFAVKNRFFAKGPFASYQIIHVPLPQHLIPFRDCRPAVLLTVHDLTHITHPQFHQEGNIANCEAGFKIAPKTVNHCITISKSTQADLQQNFPKLGRRSTVIYEAADAKSFKAYRDDEESTFLRKKYSLPHVPYLLSLSTIEPRKNLKNTIEAFMKLVERQPDKEFALFVCGKHGWKTEDLMDQIRFDKSRVIFTGFIEDSDLRRLYTDARGLCYISHYEGFGLPPIEAMRCGTPVLYGNNSSMPEVIGKGGIALNPTDQDAIVDAMETLLFNDDRRNDLSFEALKQSNQFSWRKVARQHLDLYLKYARKPK